MKVIYKQKHIERQRREHDLYLTREELMEAQERGEGCINWDKWNEVVAATKKEISELPPHIPVPRDKIIRYVYDLATDKLLLKGYAREIANAIGIRKEAVVQYSNKLHIFKKKGLWFGNEERNDWNLPTKKGGAKKNA